MDLNLINENNTIAALKKDKIYPDSHAICVLTKLNSLTFSDQLIDISFHVDYFKFRNFQINYQDIEHLFLLPHHNEIQMYFIVSIINFFLFKNLKLKSVCILDNF